MKQILLILSFLLLNKSFAQVPVKAESDRFVLVIHGGAGTILRSQMTAEREKEYRAGLDLALETGRLILESGGTALDAVEAAVRVMEDNPLFNAGRGAVFTNDGRNELDAAIMEGRTLAAGAVAGVTTIRNPITAARAVMEKSPHVFMIGKGAEQFAREQNLELVEPSYFFSQSRWNGLLKARRDDSLKILQLRQEAEQLQQKIDSVKKYKEKKTGRANNWEENWQKQLQKVEEQLSGAGTLHDQKSGTVGAVALDRHGNLAAATSTGGMTNKRYGRVGDAPIIGAGTYANNSTAAISGTGWGEFFIRLVMAKSISDIMEYGKWTLLDASNEMIMKRLPALGGDGGLVAVDHEGNIAMPFCTEGMYRGYIRNTGEKKIAIYKEE